jgi:hypothetical protein
MEKSIKSRDMNYSQPSFFELEDRREFLEDFSRRHERFPYKLSKVAEAGEKWFIRIKEAQKEAKEGKSPKEIEVWHRSLEELQNSKCGFVQAELEQFNLHSYMEALYDDRVRATHYFPEPLRSDLEPIKIGGELENRVQFLKTGEFYMRRHVETLNEKPKHLREFSGRFMNVFRSLHVGNGFRHISNHINFLEKYDGTYYADDAYIFGLDKEKEFVNSVKNVIHLGLKKIPEISRNAQNWFFTNGWSRYHPAFLLEFENRKPMIAYLSNGIWGQAYEEGELLIAEQR